MAVAVAVERKMGITGVPFSRTELSLRLSCKDFCALSRREGLEGPGVQGMPEKLYFHVFINTNKYEHQTLRASLEN